MLKEAMTAYARATEKVWSHNRSETIGASEIGQCARRVWFLKKQTQPDPGFVDRWGAKRRGDLIEAFWAKALRAYLGKGVLHYAGRYQRTFVDNDGYLSATPDGLVVPDESNRWDCYTVECKSLDPRAKMEEPRPEHFFQCQVQMALIRQQTKWMPSHARLCYIDASFLDESKEFRIDCDLAVFERARERAKQIMQANSGDELRPEGYIAGGAECEHCPFRSRCAQMRAGAVPKWEAEVAGEDITQLHRLALLHDDAKRHAEQMDQKAKDIADQIKALMRKNGTRRFDHGTLRIVWSAIKGRPAWNWPALREAAEAAGLDLAPFETVGDPADRLTITTGRAA